MSEPFYQLTTKRGIFQGDIYRFRPVPWLSPPVWIIEYINWVQRSASLRLSNLSDAFFDRSRGNQEFVLAEAKLRYVIVLYLAAPNDVTASVVPVYSFADHKNQAFLQAVEQSRIREAIFLPEDEKLGLRQSYADLSQVQPMHTRFLSDDAKVGRLSATAWQALLVQYSRCLARR